MINAEKPQKAASGVNHQASDRRVSPNRRRTKGCAASATETLPFSSTEAAGLYTEQTSGRNPEGELRLAPNLVDNTGSMAPALRLRIVLFEELPGTWVARALEHDIATEGRRMDMALRNTLGIVAAHVDFDRRNGRLPLSAFPPAPQRYWNAFARGTPLHFVPSESPLDSRIDHAQILVAVAHERPS